MNLKRADDNEDA